MEENTSIVVEEYLLMIQSLENSSDPIKSVVLWHWCTNRDIDKNIAGLLFFHHFHLKIWLSWHLAQQGKVQVVIK